MISSTCAYHDIMMLSCHHHHCLPPSWHHIIITMTSASPPALPSPRAACACPTHPASGAQLCHITHQGLLKMMTEIVMMMTVMMIMMVKGVHQERRAFAQQTQSIMETQCRLATDIKTIITMIANKRKSFS